MTAETVFRWPLPPLDAAGPFAAPVAILAWVLFAMSVAVVTLVVVALGLALFGGPKWRRRLADRKLVLAGGLGLPVIVLSAVLVYGLTLTTWLTAPPQPGEERIRVIGEMWWWRVAYLDPDGREVFHTANEIHIPAGRTVTLELRSADVIHSFWVPRLSGKLDMIPGRTNLLRLQADEPGVYRGQCAEFCGGPHALMGLIVVAQPEAQYAAWKLRQAQPAAAPAEAAGAQVFEAAGCGACHTIRGTEANGMLGPDLTHVGSRREIGAALLPNNQGTLAGWVANSQNLKPGNRMPDYHVLSGRDLRALSAYLEGLK